MPKKNPEHGARVEIRLPEAMLKAMRWTAEHDKLPLSGWIRDALNRRTFTLRRDYRFTSRECLVRGATGGIVIAERPPSDSLEWSGNRRHNKIEVPIYHDYDGNPHAGGLPLGKGNKMSQDLWMDRAKARTELRNWMHRWGIEGKTCRMKGEELRLAHKLLAKFDQDPDPELR